MAPHLFHDTGIELQVSGPDWSSTHRIFDRIPGPTRAIVARPRLLRILDRAANVTLVRALPGFGKTSLVADWAKKLSGDGVRVQWVNAADIDDTTCGLLAAEFDKSGGGVLVLEDLQLACDRILVNKLCSLAVSIPGLRLVVLATDPLNLLSSARRHGLSVQEIHGAALLADHSELEAMGAAWGFEMTTSRAANLLNLTGGWPHLAKLILEGGPDLGRDEAESFLSHLVVLYTLDPAAVHVASLLSLAATITTLCVEQSLKPFPGGDPQTAPGPETMVALEDAGLLLRCKDAAGTGGWQIPELLRDVLAKHLLAYDLAAACSWHARIAEAMFADGGGADQGMILHHARQGSAWGVLAGMWNRHLLLLVVRHPEESRAAYTDLPDAALEAEPVLGLVSAVAAAAARYSAGPQGYAAGQRALIQGFRVVRPAADKTAGQGIALREQANLTVAGMIAHRSSGRFAQAREIGDVFVRRAKGVANAGGPSEYEGITAWFRQQRALTVLLSGDTSGARVLFGEAHDCAGSREEDFIAVDAAANMALTSVLSGLPDSARDWLVLATENPLGNDWLSYLVGVPAFVARALLATDALDGDVAAVELAKAGDGGNHMELWPFIVLASTELALLRGDAVLMTAQLERVVSLNVATNSPGSAARRIVDRCRAELFLAQGELNQALRVLEDAGDCPGWLDVPQARLQLLAGNHNRAFRLAAAGAWSKNISQRDKPELLLIKAAAAEHRGDAEVAGKAFAQAVALAGTTGQLRPFRGLPSGMLTVLAGRAGISLPAADQEKVQAGPSVYPVSATLVELSLRERVVLYEMERQVSVADIAKALVVSPNTVKKQLGSIYAKMGVSDRQAALDCARRLAFLPAPDL